MADERQTQAVEASPEEARFLRRFVLRTMFPWLGCLGALAGLALGAALAPPPPAAIDAPAASDSQASAAHEKLRAEIANLREELEVLREAERAQATLPGDIEARLAKVEAELAARPMHAQTAGEAPSAESSGELITIRDRLYNLEQRLDGKEQERATVQKDMLSRLFDVERSVQTEAAARVENLETNQDRLERLERRLSTLESLPAAPASPAP
jgi:DNA repair exonuclease SbcCD ATPase subunit